jgi:hypothetical protein
MQNVGGDKTAIPANWQERLELLRAIAAMQPPSLKSHGRIGAVVRAI